MNGQKQAFIFSIGIHFLVCMLAFWIIQGTTPDRKMLTIDFSIMDQPATAHAAQNHHETDPVAEETKPLPEKIEEEPAPEEPKVQEQQTENQVAISAPEPKKQPKPLVRKKTPPPVPLDKQARRETTPAPFNTGANTNESTGTAGLNAGVPVTEISEQGGSKERPEMKYMKAHFVGIRNSIIRKLSYPPAARKNGWAGTVKVSFVVNTDGSVKDIKIHTSSGFEMLDNNAVETIRRCAPFPKPPIVVEIIMPIKYRLDG